MHGEQVGSWAPCGGTLSTVDRWANVRVSSLLCYSGIARAWLTGRLRLEVESLCVDWLTAIGDEVLVSQLHSLWNSGGAWGKRNPDHVGFEVQGPPCLQNEVLHGRFLWRAQQGLVRHWVFAAVCAAVHKNYLRGGELRCKGEKRNRLSKVCRKVNVQRSSKLY